MKYKKRESLFVRIHLTTAILVLMFFLCIPPFVSYVYSVYFFKPQQDKKARALDNVHARILDDLRFLSNNPLFSKPQYKNNAYSILKDKVAWSGSYVRHNSLFVEQYLRFQEISKFKNFNPLQSNKLELELFAKAYKLHIGSEDSLSWLAQLYHKDHWSYADQKIYSDILWNVSQKNTVERIAIAATLPVPNYNHLRDYAVLYFLSKMEQNNPLEGLKLIRHVAYLMQSSGTLIGQMTAVQMFKIEKHLTAMYAIADWQIVDDAAVDAYKRVSWAWSGIFNLVSTKEKLEAFKPYMNPEHGVCVSVHEMPMSVLGLSEFLEPKWPFEMDLMPLFSDKLLTILQLQAECDAEAYSVFLEPVPDDDWFITQEELDVNERAPAHADIGIHVFNRSKIPYIRQIYGMILTDVVVPHAFKQYEDSSN